MKSKHMRRVIALWTAAVMLTMSLGSTAMAAPSWQEDIAYVTEQGLFRGVRQGDFAPEEPLTRAMAVTVLGRVAETAGVSTGAYTDVPADAYFAPYANWAAANKLLDGGTFSPYAPMTADDLSALLDGYWATYLGRTDTPPTWLAPNGGGVTRGEAASAFAMLSRNLSARRTEILTQTAADGVELTGKLDLPASGTVDRIVLFINGSGPNTYDNQRQLSETEVFRYFDLFAQQLCARDVGFFRWNTRGVSLGDQPPLYDQIDEAVYKTYLPETSVSDIGQWITALRERPGLENAQVYLLGWSEGTMIAPLAAKAYPQLIDGLLLAGYCNDRMDEILQWQQTGGSSMLIYGHYFDIDGDQRISKEEFAADPYGVIPYLGTTWEDLDVNTDGFLTEDDFRTLLTPSYRALLDAIDRGDDAWLADNYAVRLTSGWFKAHNQLAPNRETMPTLTLPMAIFQGTLDANCGHAGAYAVKEDFDKKGKENLSLHIYEGYDHDLNYSQYLLSGTMPQAFEDLFQTCASMK